jgi:hypothetical protein
MPSTPAPLTRRLLAALETHVHEDTGPVALGDWPALSHLFDRELALITRLATAAEQEGAAHDPEIRERAAALQQRYQHRTRTLNTAADALREEQRSLHEVRRRTRAISRAYITS